MGRAGLRRCSVPLLLRVVVLAEVGVGDVFLTLAAMRQPSDARSTSYTAAKPPWPSSLGRGAVDGVGRT